ncbi:MAG TPA: hypothetical protein VHO03_17140 [Ignavibacteriales bacterium]|nr:hypothetical protein [Ignavibacteriales bacterium]
MKKFVKNLLKVLEIIAVIAVIAPVITISGILAYNEGNVAVSIALLAFTVLGALIGLLISYRMLLGRKTAVMEENIKLSTRLKLSWENNTFLQVKIGKLKNTLSEYETLIKEMNNKQQEHDKEVADLETVLVNYMEEKAKLTLEVSRLNAKLEAERAARIEAAALSGKKVLHLDILRERHIEHLQKARRQKKELTRRVEVLEDELSFLGFMYEEYWALKQKYEPHMLNLKSHAVVIDKNINLLQLPELLGMQPMKEAAELVKEIMKEAV